MKVNSLNLLKREFTAEISLLSSCHKTKSCVPLSALRKTFSSAFPGALEIL